MKKPWAITMRMRSSGLLVVFLLVAGATMAKECSSQSGPKTVALLELYTSEGCNSCPPADRWLNALKSDAAVNRERLVPLALHVDYWDYIGWKDRFADPRFTARQRSISRRSAASTIYTPQFALNGIAMPRWGDDRLLNRALDLIAASKPRADITLHLRTTSDAVELGLDTAIADAAERAGSDLYFAVYENNLVSDVRAGENTGARLHHEFVVRQWHGPIPVNGGAGTMQRILLREDWKRGELGVAAFVENRETGAVLQALAMPVCF